MERIKIYIIIFCVLVIFSLMAHIKQEEHKYENLESALKIAKDSTKHYRTKSGILIAQTQVMQLEIKQLKSNADALGIDKKALKDQVDNLQKLVVAYQGKASVTNTVYVKGKDTTIYTKGDTIKVKDFHYVGKYLDLNSIYNPLDNSLNSFYKYSSPFQITIERKSNGFLKGYHLEGKASFEDPAARIDNQKIVFIDNSKKKFYEKWWFWGLIGLGSGIYISK